MVLLYGNVYVCIEYDGIGNLLGLYLINLCVVIVVKLFLGCYCYEYVEDNGVIVWLLDDEVFYLVDCIELGSIMGKFCIVIVCDMLGLGFSLCDYGVFMFCNGVWFFGVL